MVPEIDWTDKGAIHDQGQLQDHRTDGGWAYKVGDVFSETFPSHDDAHRAAERAAREQVVPGEATSISWEDKDGRWHDELSAGGNRPQTDVED